MNMPVIPARARSAAFALICMVLLGAAAFAPLTTQETPPVSSFAPAEDLLALVNSYVDEAWAIVEDEEEFAKSDRRARVNELAEAIQVMAMALSRHDTAMDSTKPTHFAAAHKFAGDLYSSTDRQAAVKAVAMLKTALVGQAEQEQLPEWGKTDQMYDLMNQVQLSLNAVNRGMRRLARRPDPLKQNSAFLAVVGQEITTMPPEGLDETLTQRWKELSVEMRESAAALGAAARGADETAGEAAAAKLIKNCDDCHAEIRDR